jgi:acetolactate synthase-1/2/3 large subunit
MEELVRLCRRLAVGVLESIPKCVNFPANDPLYLGNYWNEPVQDPHLAKADLILALDTELPWIPLHNAPSKSARIYHIDVDPLKAQMPLWHIAAKKSFRSDVAIALRQINERLDASAPDDRAVAARRAYYAERYQQRQKELRAREQCDSEEITPEHLTARVREHVDANAVFLIEGVTNGGPMFDHLGVCRPGAIYTSGGGSLGWNGGAAIGVKLALPEKTVVCLTGDGSYMFSMPSTVHWMARRYGTPFLQIIYNNRGWRAPKVAALAIHPDGYASKAKDIDSAFDPPPDYAGIAAAAGGAFAQTVRRSQELDDALQKAMKALRDEQRSAVLDVWLPHL